MANGGGDPPNELRQTALQARADRHQAILKEYRTRGYQLTLAHAGLAAAAGRYAAGRTMSDAIPIGLAMLVLTIPLCIWLGRLRDKSDGHVRDVLRLYEHLQVGLELDGADLSSRSRLWGPLVSFPWFVLGALWIWLLGTNLSAICGAIHRTCS